MGCAHGKQKRKKGILEKLNQQASEELIQPSAEVDVTQKEDGCKEIEQLNNIIENEGFQEKVNHIQLLYEKLLESNDDGRFDQRSVQDPNLDDFLKDLDKFSVDDQFKSIESIIDIAKECGEAEITNSNPIANKVLLSSFRLLATPTPKPKKKFSIIKGQLPKIELEESEIIRSDSSREDEMNQKVKQNGIQDQNNMQDQFNFSNFQSFNTCKRNRQKQMTIVTHFEEEEELMQLSNIVKKSSKNNLNINDLLQQCRTKMQTMKTDSFTDKANKQISPRSMQLRPAATYLLSASQFPSSTTKECIGEAHVVNSLNCRSTNLNEISLHEIDQDFKENSIKPMCQFSHLRLRSFEDK